MFSHFGRLFWLYVDGVKLMNRCYILLNRNHVLENVCLFVI